MSDELKELKQARAGDLTQEGWDRLQELLALESSHCSPVDHLVMLHRVLYNTVTDREALDYLNRFRREDADFADLGRPLKCQYQENTKD